MTQHVALYCRISLDRSGRREGVDAQEEWGRDYAASAWPDLPVELFADSGISAANGDHRPQYERLREWIAAGHVAHLWCVEQSRLERREVEWFRLAAELDAAGIAEVHTNRDGIVRVRDDVAGIKAVLAAGEVRRLKRRVSDRLAEIAADGRPQGGQVFGYRRAVDPTGGKTLEIVPEQAEIIRDTAGKVLAGWALANIARDLRDRGVCGGHGGTVTANTVRRWVTNPTVAGQRMHQGRIIGAGNWPPILDMDTWQACRAKLAQKRKVHRRDGGQHEVTDQVVTMTTGRRYLLTGGLARCGVCGAPLVGAMRRISVGRDPVPYLTCHPNKGGHGCVGILLTATEGHVVNALFDELDKPAFLEAIAADDHAGRRDELVAAMAAVEAQRGELAAMWGAPGQLSTVEWQAARRALADHEQQLRRDLAAVPPPLAGVDIAEARSAWPAMTLDEQREFVRLFVERVTVNRATPGARRFDPARVAVEWRKR